MTEAARVREHLFSLNTRGIKYDLERMREAVRRCGNPHLACPAFHVAGTNGKGSVCAYLESVLRDHGLKAGLYTSPHLVNFEERFAVGGKTIDERQWLDIYNSFRATIDQLALTFFEAATLMAFELFRRENVDWAVIETGLGGRLDATNVVHPRVSVITRLALDHAEYLGADLLSVAREKLGIVKPGVPLVMAEPPEPDLRDLALSHCASVGSSCTFVTCDPELIVEDPGDRGTRFRFDGREYTTPLHGSYQAQNASLALAALTQAGFTEHGPAVSGIAATRLAGRFQVVDVAGRTVIFDVGHNPDAARAMVDALERRYGGKAICIVTGIMKDKDFAGVIEAYRRVASHLLFTRPAIARAADPEELRAAVPGDFAGKVEVVKDVAAATRQALATSAEIVCIAGSFHTVGEAMIALGVDTHHDEGR